MPTMSLTTSMAVLWLGVAVVLYHQTLVVHGLANENQSPTRECRPFNKSSGLAEFCGYETTLNSISVRDEFDFRSIFRYAPYSLAGTKSNCSKNLKLLFCSDFFSRCVSSVRGPFLPCREVCLDVFSRCGEELRNISTSFYWRLQWICNLFPEKDEPSTNDYRKRCFVPPDIKTCAPKCNVESPRCFPLIYPECQNRGYNFTIYPENYQRLLMKYRSTAKLANSSTYCGAEERRKDCLIYMPPCLENKFMGTWCREDCLSFVRSNCSTSYIKKENCLFFPKRPSDSRICKRTEFDNLTIKRTSNGVFRQKGNLTLVLAGVLSSCTLVAWFFGK